MNDGEIVGINEKIIDYLRVEEVINKNQSISHDTKKVIIEFAREWVKELEEQLENGRDDTKLI